MSENQGPAGAARHGGLQTSATKAAGPFTTAGCAWCGRGPEQGVDVCDWYVIKTEEGRRMRYCCADCAFAAGGDATPRREEDK